MKDVNKMSKKQLEKAAWMGKFEVFVCRLAPQLRGKIHWDDATYHFNQGRSEEAAAKAYVDSYGWTKVES